MGCCSSTTGAVSAQASARCDLSESLVCNPRVQAAIEQFNGGAPGKAIESLGLENEPEALAAFLHRTPSLDTAILGEMLSEPKREPLMRTYVQWLDLSNLTLDAAMRRLLRGFRLPGEAQKIDRIMDAFAEHWLSCQAVGGKAGPLTTDTAFLMSFALIMLNTDLHNPSVKRKMSLPQFQSNLRGVNAGQDLPSPFVAKLYDNVKREEFCMNSRLTGSSGRSRSRSNSSISSMGRNSSSDSSISKINSAAIVPDLHSDTLTRLSCELRSRRISCELSCKTDSTCI